MEDLLFATVADDGLPVRHRAAKGGRGSTKSHSFARGLLFRGGLKRERIFCGREIQKSIDGSVKQLLDDLIPQMGFGPTNGDGFYHSQKTEIMGRNGTSIDFFGLRSNIDSIKSQEGFTLAYISEARSVSQTSIQKLTPTIRTKGSEIWWDWNPEHATDPVDAMFVGGTPPPGSIVRHVNFTENPWFGDPLKSEMEWDRARDPDKYNHIWLGGYLRNSQARVFKNWSIERFETPDDARFYFGADWGFSVDPSVLVRMFIGRMGAAGPIADPTGRTLFIDHEAYAVGCEIDDTPALFAGDDTHNPKRWENPQGPKHRVGIPGAIKWPITADSARPETISFMRRKGFNITPAVKGPGSVEEGVTFLQNYDIMVHPRCLHVIDELTLYSWKVDPITGEVLPVLEDKKNHTIDACRYALEGVRRSGYDLSALLG
jgi:phage terminase large subunit